MKQKVLFHVDEMERWKLLLHNVKNLLSSYDANDAGVLIEVVANGEAVKAYIQEDGNSLRNKMESLAESGVLFAACNNALTGWKIAKEHLFPFVNVVPAGVRELVDRQTEGYAYIKP